MPGCSAKSRPCTPGCAIERLRTEPLNGLKSAASISTMILTHTLWVSLFSVKESFGCRHCVQLFIALCWCNWWCQVPVHIFASLKRARHIQLSKYHVLVRRERKTTSSLGFVETVCHLSPPFSSWSEQPSYAEKMQDLRYSVILSLKQH